MLRLLLIPIVLALTTGSALAEQMTVLQSLDKFEMPYEGVAHFQIVLTWPGPQSAYFFDKPLQPQLQNLKVKQFSSTISSNAGPTGEVTSKKFDFTLAPTGSGEGRIEPVTISYVTWPDSVPGSLMTEGMSIRIAAAIATKGSGKGVSFLAWYWWVAEGVAVIGVVFVILWIRRSRRPKPVVRTPADLFLERLSSVRADSSGDLKRFQTSLYKHLIWYLNAQYGLGLATQPTEEMIHIIDASHIPEAEKHVIGAWLIRADREKFSPAAPAPGETIRIEAEVREFFEKMVVRA